MPRRNSSGGKVSLGQITKRGDDYLRTLLIQRAESAVMIAHERDDVLSRWLVHLKQRVGWQLACVAMANKNAYAGPSSLWSEPGICNRPSRRLARAGWPEYR